MGRFVPKLVITLREGYTGARFAGDLVAGITVGIVALPLAMAFGIASIPPEVAQEAGISPPAVGLFTAVVAGVLISAFGGSRVQIGGPTGAFIVIVYSIAATHGYDGLATATLKAGVFVIVMGLARFGRMVKFIPYPVTTGFTSGIAVVIFSSQVKEFLGLEMGSVPVEFVEKWQAFAEHVGTLDAATVGVSLGSLGIILAFRRFAPRIPGPIVAVIVASAVVAALNLPVETIGSRFGGIPRTLPTPRVPEMSWDQVRSLIPDAGTIAMLVAIESLLSAVVADGMIGGRHKADCELVAQGLANLGSVIFGGIPATGAIARTATNVKAGGRTPIAGMIHAVTLLVIMLAAAPLAGAIPLATLSAVLVIVAWNMAEIDHFRSLFRAPKSDIAVLLTTFGLTVFADLTLAVGVGMVLAAMLFMKRMADVSEVSAVTRELENGESEVDETRDALPAFKIPVGVEVYEITGPFFFGVADRLKDALSGIERPPKVFILRMRRVPAIDATGLHALEEFYRKCARQGTLLLLSGVHPQPRHVMEKSGFADLMGESNIYSRIEGALTRAREFVST